MAIYVILFLVWAWCLYAITKTGKDRSRLMDEYVCGDYGRSRGNLDEFQRVSFDQILFEALVLACFIVCFCYAIRLILKGEYVAGLAFLGISAGGIFSLMLIGLALIFGLP